MSYHANIPKCPGCEEKLKQAHPKLRAFAYLVRQDYEDAHICWSYRGKDDQNAAFAEGKSADPWPHSKHNVLPAKALDWFELSPTGKAIWNDDYFAKVLAPRARNMGFVWGGDWKHRHDADHVELPEN